MYYRYTTARYYIHLIRKALLFQVCHVDTSIFQTLTFAPRHAILTYSPETGFFVGFKPKMAYSQQHYYDYFYQN